jgi:hypothetical protein
VNFNFNSSIHPNRLDVIRRVGDMKLGSFSGSLTEQSGFPLVYTGGNIIAYNLEKNGSATQLDVLFVTYGGVVRASIDYIDVANTAWPQPQIPVSELDYDKALTVLRNLDRQIEQMNKIDSFEVWGGGYILLEAVNNEDEQKGCRTFFAGLNNISQLCRYDPTDVPTSPEQMLDKIISHIVSMKGKTAEEVFNFEGYPILSSEGNISVTLQIP